MKAFKDLLSSSISTCQYPHFKSRDMNIFAPFKQSSVSSILGRPYASLIILVFKCPKSIQNLRLPSFLHTKTTALAQELSDHLIAPISNISLRCFLTSSYICGGILLLPILKWCIVIESNFMFHPLSLS